MFESSPKLLSQNRFSSGLHWVEREWIDLMEEVQRPLQPVREHIYDLYIYIYMQTKKSDSVHLRPPRLLPDICLTVASPEPHLLMHEAHLNHNRTISQVVSSDKKQHPTTYQLLLCIRSQRSRWSCLTSGQQCLLLSPCLHS